MAYNINNFVRVVSQGDRNLQIIDNNGTVKYAINPYQILNILQNNNLLKINLKSGKMITLDFQNSTEAIESVLTLQEKIDELTNITPFTIDKDVENWVEDVNLITPKGGTLSIWGDLLPGTTSTYNIGSLEYEWHTLYVGSQSLVVGGVTISSASGSIMMSSMNLGSMDDPLILTYDGLNLLINGTTSNFSGHFDTNKLVNGDLELSLDEKGTLNFPVILPVSFTAVCDTEHIIGTYSPFINQNWWEFEVEFFVNADGSVETIINNIFPILTNPGYVSGNSFRFTVLDHGIPDFDFDILLDDVISAGPAGWTSNLLVSQPPTYPSTISSLGNLKFTSNGNTFLFGNKFYIEGVDYLSKGGTLSQTLQIDSDNNDYVITGADNLILSSSVFDVVTDFISLDSNESGQILVDEDLSIMAGGQLVIIGSSSNITITGGQGLVYTQDYSSTFVDNSLVTKKFVLGGGIRGLGTNYILVSADGTPTENANELQTAYDKAITLSPGIDNRITILLANGYYNFSQNFELTENYIDLVSLDGNISVIFNGIGTVEITANDVFVKGINVLDKNFTIGENLNLLIVENCQGGDFSFGGVDSGETEIIVSGRFINCQGGDLSFGGNGEATGYFKDCVGGDESFGFLDTSGTFLNCKGGDFSFGFAGVMNGTFENCTGGTGSFGTLGIIIDSEAKRCESTSFAFGFQAVGIVDSVFDACVAGLGSYGLNYDIVNEGKYYYCRLTEGLFDTPSLGGVVVLGIDGNNSVQTLPSVS